MKKIKVIALVTAVCLLMPMLAAGVVQGGGISGAEFYEWLDSTGIPEYSISGSYRANYSTYVRYNLIVYGSAGMVQDNEIRQGEYRYLGFTYKEGKYTNLDFPNDETGNLTPEQWNYVTVPGAMESWYSLEQTVQRPYLLHTPLKGHGAKILTASDIGTDKAKVQSAASWNTSGSIYTFKSNGFYASFTVPSMGPGILSAHMTPDDSLVYVNADDGYFTTGLTLIASVNKPKEEVEFIKVVFSCGDWSKVRYFRKTNSINISQGADLDIPDNLPGNAKISAHVTSESIFGDKLSRNLSCNISVYEGTGNSTPGPSPTATPRPTANPTPTPYPTTAPPTTTPSPGDGTEPGDNGGSGNTEDDNRLRIIDINVSGSWNHWESEPHRFLALERITVEATVSGKANYAIVRLSPQLEAMIYTNSSGQTYNYKEDFFGYNVKFPQDSTIQAESTDEGITTFKWVYSIPLCDETIGWDDAIKAEAYKIGFRVYENRRTHKTIIIEDIDITGNIYELLYPQPAD